MIPTVSVDEVDSSAYLLDVREDDEWDAGHAPGASHLPMMDIPARLRDVPRDRDVVVVCRVGGRSGQVVNYLRRLGFENVSNLEGGMISWAASGRPMVAESGHDPHVL